MNSSYIYYYNNISTWNNWVYLNNTPPNATSISLSPSQEGWGVVYTYNVTINDSQFDNVSCTLYTNTTGSWVYRGNDTVYNGAGVCSINVSNFLCSDIGINNY